MNKDGENTGNPLLLTMFIMFAIIQIGANGLSMPSIPEAIMWVILLALIVWFSLPLRRKRGESEHQGAANSLSFRLGKALNRVFRRFHS